MSFRTYIKRGLQYILHGIPHRQVTAHITYVRPDKRLEGKKIIITGASRGLGAAMAKTFTLEGAQVLITGRDEQRLASTAETIGCAYLKQDMQDLSAFPDFLRQAAHLLGGGIQCLVNNAGISLHEGNIRQVSEEQFDAQIGTNLKGSYFLSQAFIKHLEAHQQQGSLLFITSERGIYADDLPYGLTKAALNSLVQGLAKRLVGSGIRVNALAPGVTASDMTGLKADGNLFCPWNITNRVYLPEEVAEIACYLLSDASRLLNGQILVCNEGKSINFHD